MHPGFPARARAAVETHGGRVRFVRLRVSDDEQERRIADHDRRAFHELTDVGTLRRLRDHRRVVGQPPADLEVDTGTSSAARTAALVAAHVGLTARARTERYPQPG